MAKNPEKSQTLSEAKDLQLRPGELMQILRFAQNDSQTVSRASAVWPATR
jgi:hypothetical protein